jgi:hypothetical protein
MLYEMDAAVMIATVDERRDVFNTGVTKKGKKYLEFYRVSNLVQSIKICAAKASLKILYHHL